MQQTSVGQRTAATASIDCGSDEVGRVVVGADADSISRESQKLQNTRSRGSWGLVLVPRREKQKQKSTINQWGFNTSYYSLETLASRLHDHELINSSNNKKGPNSNRMNETGTNINDDHDHDHDQVYVHLDQYSMGLGGYDSW